MSEVKIKRQIVYIAGKYRSRWGLPGRAWHIYKAWLAGRRLVKQGYSCFIPHLNTCFMDGFFGIGKCNSDEFFLEACLKQLRDFEIIYMMRGWESSNGARQELREAFNRKMVLWGDGFPAPVPFPAFEKLYKQWELNNTIDQKLKSWPKEGAVTVQGIWVNPLPFDNIEPPTPPVNCKLQEGKECIKS